MSEITCENFYTELPAIEDAIKKSAFVGFDMEFSKLHDIIAKPFTYFDTTEERYCKLRQKVSDITCIQLGIAIFTYDANQKSFKTCTYSFYTYPQTFYKSDSSVNFQTSCVEFLCKHKFDFNKLFHNRISYLTDEQENTISVEMKDNLFFDKYFESNLKFRSIEEELIKVLNIISDWYDNADYGECTDLEINGCNEPAFIILMQYFILKKFKYVCVNENQSGLCITKKEEENMETLNNIIYQNLKQCLLNKMMGVKTIIKLISKLKKPIVGHNCALDILILCNQFFKPLPEKFKDYQSFVSNSFGPIYDTKFLCKEIKRIIPKTDNCFGNSLPELYSFLNNGNAKIYSESMCVELTGIKEPQNMKLHHAGWDAYYTGYCFVKMIHIVKSFSSKTENIYQTYTLTELLKSIEFSKNKLYTNRSLSGSINLEMHDQHEQKKCLIVFKKGILYKALNLLELKTNLKRINNYDIKLLSKYTALIASPMNKSIINSIKSEYVVENYSNYQNRKKKHYIILLSLIMCTSVTVLTYLRK